MKNSIHGIEIDSAKIGLVKTEDREFIDFTSGIFAANLGMWNPVVSFFVQEQLAKLHHAYQFQTKIRNDYLSSLCEFTGFEAAYMFSSGTEAVEAAWKIARLHTGREGILNLAPHAFHGKTLGAQIAAGVEPDYRNQMTAEKTGCLIFEPYVALTAKFHRPELIENILALKNRYNLLLIADEIQAGFYRTGKLFGYQHYPGLKPDLVCIGKGMTNGLPGSAVLGPKALIDNPLMDLSSTNGGHPIVCAAGMAVLSQMIQPAFSAKLKKNIEAFTEGLQGLNRQVNVKGMVAAILFDSVDEADQAVLQLTGAGLLVVHTKGPTMKLGPPLNIEGRILKKGLTILKGVVGR